MNLLGVEEDDHENIFTSRYLLKDSNSKRGDIASHIQSAFEDKRLGDFLTIQEIRNHRSTGYGVDNPTNPSAGAISARLFPTSGSCTVPRSEERRTGNEWVGTFRFRCSPSNLNKKQYKRN